MKIFVRVRYGPIFELYLIFLGIQPVSDEINEAKPEQEAPCTKIPEEVEKAPEEDKKALEEDSTFGSLAETVGEVEA